MTKDIKRVDFNIWNKVWKNDPYSSEKLRKMKAKEKIHVLLENIQVEEHTKVGDFGCGAGFLSKELYDKKKCEIIGIDFSEVAVKQAKERFEDSSVKFQHRTILDTGIETESLDLVICSGSLEHINEIDSALMEINRVLKPSGYIYITSSNKMSFMYIHRIVKESMRAWKYGYQKNYTTWELSKLVKKNGFSVLNNSTITGIGDFRLINLLDKFISLFNNKWGRYIVIVGRKK